MAGDDEGIRGVSPGLIEAVQRDIYTALARTTARSPLSEEEQDELLSQACAQACDVLDGWLRSPQWQGLEPSGRGAVADLIPDWQRVRAFVEPVRETLERISERDADVVRILDIPDPATYLDQMISAAERTVRRHRKLDRRDLFTQATERTGRLRDTVCGLASDLKQHADSHEKWARRKRRAWSVLKTVAGLMLSLVLTTTPGAIAENVPAWGHEAVKVLFVHDVAHTAAPTVQVAPPEVGPRLGGL